jgi:hypothetical protein
MKKLILVFCLSVVGIFGSFDVQGSTRKAEGALTLSDTLVFDLSAATYSNSGGIYYIDIPVLIYSTTSGINGLDFYFAFNLNKMTYESTVSLVGGLSTLSYFSPVTQLLTNTSSGTSVTYSAPLYTQLLKLRFILADACTEIVPSDFSNILTLINGNPSSYLFVGPAEAPPFEIQQPQPYCSTQDIVFNYPYTTINGRTIQSYAWDFGNGQTSDLQTATAVYATEGDYPVTLTLTTVDGCVYPLQNFIPIYPSPVAAFSSLWDEPTNVVSFTNESTISSGSINLYTWDFGGSTSNLQNPDYTFPIPGYYDVTLTATSDLGCTSSITQLVTAIDIIELDNRNFHIFPNPANDFIQIESNVHTVGRITDVTGRILTENFIIQANQVTSFDVSNLATGYYFLESVDLDTVLRERFVVEN